MSSKKPKIRFNYIGAIALGALTVQFGFSLKREYVAGTKHVYKVTYKSDVPENKGLSFEEGILEEIVESVAEKQRILVPATNNKEAVKENYTEVVLRYNYKTTALQHLSKKLEFPKLFKDGKAILANGEIQHLYFGSTPLPYFSTIANVLLKRHQELLGNNSFIERNYSFFNTLDYNDLGIQNEKGIEILEGKIEQIKNSLPITCTVETVKKEENSCVYHFSAKCKSKSTAPYLGSYASSSRRNFSMTFDEKGVIKDLIFALPQPIVCMPLTPKINEYRQYKNISKYDYNVTLQLHRLTEDPIGKSDIWISNTDLQLIDVTSEKNNNQKEVNINSNDLEEDYSNSDDTY